MAEWDAGEYARHTGEIQWYERTASILLDFLGDVDCLIDFACGTGRVSRQYLRRRHSPRGLRLYLVDHSSNMLDATADIRAPGVAVFRGLCGEDLPCIPDDESGRIDGILCANAFHLLRDDRLAPTGDRLVMRAYQLLRPSGCLAVSIPEQAWSFPDGWQSSVYRAASALWGPSPGRATLPMLSEELLRSWADDAQMDLHLETRQFPFTWREFLHFYSIPGIGGDRISTLPQADRWEYLATLRPQFDVVDYRVVFANFIPRPNIARGAADFPSVREENAAD